MTTNKQKLSHWNRSKAQLAADMEQVVFNARREYRNTGVAAFSEEAYVLHSKVDFLTEVASEQGKTIAHLQMQINEMQNMMMKLMRTGATQQEEEETHIEVTVTMKTRKKKWDKDTIFETFDQYARERRYFGPITPQIVRDNWSTLFNNIPRYVPGETLKSVLKEYAASRKLNY